MNNSNRNLEKMQENNFKNQQLKYIFPLWQTTSPPPALFFFLNYQFLMPCDSMWQNLTETTETTHKWLRCFPQSNLLRAGGDAAHPD